MRTRKAGCLFKIITSLALSLLILFLIIYLSIPYLVTSAVHIAGKTVGLEMELDSFSLNIPEQSIELEDFYINNPEGFNTDSKAISLDKLHLDLDSALTNYFSKDLVDVENLVVDGFSMTFEATSLSALLLNENNVTAILEKLRSEEAKEAKNPTDDKIIIRKMSFKNGNVKVIVSGVKMDIALPDFEVDDIGAKEGGISYLSAVIEILSEISAQSISQVSKQTSSSLMDMGSSLMKGLDSAGSSVNKLMEGTGTIFDGF